MGTAKAGDKVEVHYTGSLEDGTVFDSSKGRDPLAFTIGEKTLIRGFEEAVVGMAVGNSKSVHIPAIEAYGEHDPARILKVPLSDLPEGINPQEGQQLQMRQSSGQAVMVRISEVTETDITLDANHPLAGKNLNFEIELVKVN